MAGPVYKLWMTKPTEAWYQLSEEEQEGVMATAQASLEEVGGKLLLRCTPGWASEEWMLFGVEEFPSIEAVQQHTMTLFEAGHFRYTEGKSMLGIKWPLE
jgi:hypothetical protein